MSKNRRDGSRGYTFILHASNGCPAQRVQAQASQAEFLAQACQPASEPSQKLFPAFSLMEGHSHQNAQTRNLCLPAGQNFFQ
jgi:hypothetical protein